MRFFQPTILALAATSVTANSLTLKPRAFIDVCANVNANLAVNVPIIGTVVVGHLNLCLCVSALPVFITTNLVAIAGVTLVGVGPVNAILVALVCSPL